MKRTTFIPDNDIDRLAWLQNFAAKLPTYAAKYGITDAEITDMQNGAKNMAFYMNMQQQLADLIKKITKYRADFVRVNKSGNEALPPQLPAFAAAPTPVKPGLFKRASSLGIIIKTKMAYTPSDGADLGLTTPKISADTDVTPKLKARLVGGGKPQIMWQKGLMDGIEIFADRGDGRFIFLAFDTKPHFTDEHPLPAPNQSAIWNYKAIYRKKDIHVGNWSDVISVVVRG